MSGCLRGGLALEGVYNHEAAAGEVPGSFTRRLRPSRLLCIDSALGACGPAPHTLARRSHPDREAGTRPGGLWEAGYARYIGVSSFDAKKLEEAIHAMRRAEIVVDRVHYSVLYRRRVGEELLSYAIRENVAIQAYTPLERCRVARHPKIVKVARRTGRTPVRVALNYLVSRSR